MILYICRGLSIDKYGTHRFLESLEKIRLPAQLNIAFSLTSSFINFK